MSFANYFTCNYSLWAQTYTRNSFDNTSQLTEIIKLLPPPESVSLGEYGYLYLQEFLKLLGRFTETETASCGIILSSPEDS